MIFFKGSERSDRKKENKKRMREERLVSASLLTCFFDKLGFTDTFIINKVKFKILSILNNIVLKIALFGGLGFCFD